MGVTQKFPVLFTMPAKQDGQIPGSAQIYALADAHTLSRPPTTTLHDYACTPFILIYNYLFLAMRATAPFGHIGAERNSKVTHS